MSYVPCVALLSSLGFEPSYRMTMTNKIRDVELVWTLGAMLAKSAELANEGGGSGFRGGLLLLAAVRAPTTAPPRKLAPLPAGAR